MKVLFIGKRHYTNRDAFIERYGRIYQLPANWARNGTKTQLWLIDYHGRQRASRHENGLKVDSTPVRGIAWLLKTIGIVFSRLTAQAPTHIIASGDSYIGLLGWLLARLTGASFVFDVYDKYDEFGGYKRPLGWDLFGFLLKHADQCWFASRRLLNQMGKPERGDKFVPNGINIDRFKPRDLREARKRLGLPSDAVLVGYFGGLSTERGTPDLIEAVRYLRKQGIAVELVLAGKIQETIDLAPPYVHYLGNLSHAQIPWALAAADVIAVPYRRSAFLDAASSVKFGEIMACGRPFVATRTPNFEENFPEQFALLQNYLTPPQQPEALARAIAKQLQDHVVVPIPVEIEWSALGASTVLALNTICPCNEHN